MVIFWNTKTILLYFCCLIVVSTIMLFSVRPSMDVAYNQPTYQTSVERSEAVLSSDRSVDGYTDTCACTLSEPLNVYQVDLQLQFNIMEVIIVNTYKDRKFFFCLSHSLQMLLFVIFLFAFMLRYFFWKKFAFVIWK